MQGNGPFKLEQNVIVRVVCLLTFAAFTFVYLYFYQADIVAAGQHILAQGQTHYNRLIGAIVVTVLLCILQTVIYRYVKLEGRAHAITYMPSLLILTFISSIGCRADVALSFGAWPWAGPALLVLFGLLVWVAKEVEPYEPEGTAKGVFPRVLWINLALLVLQFLLVGFFSNHNDVFHYRMRMERLILQKDYKQALQVGCKSLAADSSLTMLRAHALAAQKQLPEKFFDYPVVGGADALRTNRTSVRTVMVPDSVISWMVDSSEVAPDFKLMALLLNRKLVDFAEQVRTYYPDSVMPKIYEEALMQYYYSNGKPFATGENVAMETDFRDFNEARLSIVDKHERYTTLRRVYGNTYWFYYRYGGH